MITIHTPPYLAANTPPERKRRSFPEDKSLIFMKRNRAIPSRHAVRTSKFFNFFFFGPKSILLPLFPFFLFFPWPLKKVFLFCFSFLPAGSFPTPLPPACTPVCVCVMKFSSFLVFSFLFFLKKNNNKMAGNTTDNRQLLLPPPCMHMCCSRGLL